MREILFKAKRIDNGEWIEGAVLPTADGTCYIATSYLVARKDEPLIVAAREVNPETLCQYTGLEYKDGNLIWENDIVSCMPGEYHFAYREYRKVILVDDYETILDLFECEDLKVLGNKFDNPELKEEQIE